MQTPARVAVVVSGAFLCLSPHAVFAAEPPDTVTVVISPGDAVPPPEADGQTVTLTGPFPPVPAPTPRKSSKQKAPVAPAPAPTPASPPPSRARAVIAPAREQRAAVDKPAESPNSVRGGASRPVSAPPVARGGASAVEHRVASVSPAEPLAAASAAVGTRAPESTGWVLPGVLLGLLAGFGLFIASRFAYWRWAIHRSRCQVDASSHAMPGSLAPNEHYALYRGTRRWRR
jgi:hypothetical protein